MPPIDDALRDALLQAAWQSMLLPMVAAAMVFLGFLFVPRSAFFGAVLAVVVGFAAANHFRDAVDPRPADPRCPGRCRQARRSES